MADENRRKISNIVIDPKAMFRFSIPFFIILLGNFAIVHMINAQIAESALKLQSAESPAVLAASVKLTEDATRVGLIGVAVFGVVIYFFWLIYSHRIFGPEVPIRRHIQSLRDGNYESRIRLRKRDEFKGLADDLNQLAETLQNQSQR